MKKYLLGLSLALISVAAAAQPMTSTIKAQAADMARAVLAKDLNKMVKYLPPKLVEASGGMAKMMQARDTVNKYMTQFGAEIKHVNIGNPGPIVTYKNQLQTTLPQTTELKVMNSTIVAESTLIAISEDKGKNWYFVDTSIYGGKKLQTALPDLSPDLVIPPRKQPKIISNQ